MNSALALQVAHIALLKADPTLKKIIKQRVFSYVPRQTTYPYICYMISESREWDDSSGDGSEHIVGIHAFTDGEGTKSNYEILGAAHKLLQNRTDLVLTDHTMVNCRRTFYNVDREDDQVYHGISRYRVITQEN